MYSRFSASPLDSILLSKNKSEYSIYLLQDMPV